jgi:predicted permease
MDRDREIDDELRFHLETEAEAQLEAGASPVEAQQNARRELGNLTLLKEETRMIWTWHWWEQFSQDARYSWRQLVKSPATSAAAVLSLGLAIGACMAAFRLIDALLLRPLPIAGAGNLYLVARAGVGPNGQFRTSESASYPHFLQMRAAAAAQGEMIAISYSERVDLTYGADADMEKAHRQYVSGSMFQNFGLRPRLGRLLTDSDDQTPGAHRYAVLSYDYWTRRFGQDPHALGRTFRQGNDLYEIIGVLSEGFTGTEPGTMIDIFVPMSMQSAATLQSDGSFWLRAFIKVNPGTSLAPLRDKLHALYVHHERERAKTFVGLPKKFQASFGRDQMVLLPAQSGTSELQKSNRLGLAALGILVVLVLLIACANVGNLMMARALARAREMALRISIGASRSRLVRLVLVESGWIAMLATGLGAAFASWAAPFVVSLINPPSNPARIVLPADWRVLGFGILLTAGVTLIFGLFPALRVSTFVPASALKGGEDPHSRRRLMHALVAAQVAFCFVVLFAGGLFVKTYDQLTHQPVGFSTDRILAIETVVKKPQPATDWEQLAQHLRSVPGVETVAYSEWPLMSNEMRNYFIAFNGGPPVETLTYFYRVSPGWRETMKVHLRTGRDFRENETFPGTAIVNETFAKTYLRGENPVGRVFEIPKRKGLPVRVEIVGLVADAQYSDMRSPVPPVAYAPFAAIDDQREPQPNSRATFTVRTAGSQPLALAASLRRAVSNFRSDFRVSNIRTQQEIVDAHTIRERLLAILALFFSVVALVLAAVGLYGVLDYSVLQRRREIGIRMALGSPVAAIVRGVTAQTFAMVMIGALAGGALGYLSQTYIETLLYGIRPNDWTLLALPAGVLLAGALAASVTPVIRTIRLDPIQTLRND